MIEFDQFPHDGRFLHIPPEVVRPRGFSVIHLIRADHEFHWTESPPMDGGDMRIVIDNRLFKIFESESSEVLRMRRGAPDRSAT
jgi:hypothetical protein